MKLIGLSIEGLRKIKAARLDFDGQHLIQIRGENGAGKSTVLDAVKYLFQGTKEIPADVVQHGEAKAEIVGTLDEYVIRRVIKSDGKSTLTVEQHGGKIGSPQKFLDTIAGKFLDPQWFSELPGPEKKNVLMDYLNLDLSTYDEKIAQAEQDRLLCGRELKSIGRSESVEKVEEVSLSALMQERQEIIRFNQEQEEIQEEIDKKVLDLKSEIVKGADLIHAPEDFLSHLDWLKEWIPQRTQKIKELPQPKPFKDLKEIEEKIDNAEEHNKKAAAYTAYIQQKEKHDAKQREYDTLNKAVKALRQEKAAMLKNADLPVKGLEITDTGLSHDGITDENWSDSQSMKISLLLSLAFSGELRTVYIKRGESLDSDSLQKLKSLAEKKDFQVIMEIVDDSYAVNDNGVFYIEEGEIVPVSQEEKTA